MAKTMKLFIILFLLFACKKEEETMNPVLYDYQDCLNELMNHNEFEEKSDYFNTMLVLNETNQGNIRYDLIIHHPKTVLRHVKVMCIPENFDASTQTAPCLGILDNEDVTLIANRVDADHSIYKGVNLSGISKSQVHYVYVYITYEVEAKTYTEYLKVEL